MTGFSARTGKEGLGLSVSGGGGVENGVSLTDVPSGNSARELRTLRKDIEPATVKKLANSTVSMYCIICKNLCQRTSSSNS